MQLQTCLYTRGRLNHFISWHGDNKTGLTGHTDQQLENMVWEVTHYLSVPFGQMMGPGLVYVASGRCRVYRNTSCKTPLLMCSRTQISVSKGNKLTQRGGWGLSSRNVEAEPLAKQTRKSTASIPGGFG
jgi:hypothetical protein